MGAHTDRLDSLVDSVTAAAIPTSTGPLFATRDPTKIQQGRPALLVVADTVTWPNMCGDGQLDAAALLVGVASDPAMSELLDVVDAVANLIQATQARRVTWTAPGGDPLPAFQLS